MIIMLLGWFLWFMVQAMMALFTPLRPLALREKQFRRIHVLLRWMQLKALWVQREYEFYFWTPPLCHCGLPAPDGEFCYDHFMEWSLSEEQEPWDGSGESKQMD